MSAVDDPVLSVRDLTVVYDTMEPVTAVDAVSFDLGRGEILGLAGESGCGKSTLAYGIQRLLQPPAVVTGGHVLFRDEGARDASGGADDAREIDVLALGEAALRRFRWDRVSMVFQGAMNALNPVLPIGAQLEDVFRAHRPAWGRARRRAACQEVLDVVRIDRSRYRAYPHELSGGMRQRVMIAMALVLRPRVMVMDEPTTALDMLVQREILDEISRLRHEFGFSVIFITHDLPLLLEISDRIAVMRAGRIVECAPARELWESPQHEYTRTLLASFPRLMGERGVLVP